MLNKVDIEMDIEAMKDLRDSIEKDDYCEDKEWKILEIDNLICDMQARLAMF